MRADQPLVDAAHGDRRTRRRRAGRAPAPARPCRRRSRRARGSAGRGSRVGVAIVVMLRFCPARRVEPTPPSDYRLADDGRADDRAVSSARRLRSSPASPASKSGEFEAAAQHFLASLAAFPGRASTLVNLAATQLELARPADALASADAALRAEPDGLDALLHRATALMQLGRYQEAVPAFDRLLAADAGVIEAWFRRGQDARAPRPTRRRAGIVPARRRPRPDARRRLERLAARSRASWACSTMRRTPFARRCAMAPTATCTSTTWRRSSRRAGAVGSRRASTSGPCSTSTPTRSRPISSPSFATAATCS